jgi:pimeloyl-ACP methyl ester carboxylesterase
MGESQTALIVISLYLNGQNNYPSHLIAKHYIQYITRGVIGKLSAVTNPVLLVGGLNDPVVPPANVRLMAQRIAKSWLTIFPGRHGALLEWANTFTALFEEFYSVYGNVQ